MERKVAGRLLCDFISGRKIAATRLETLSAADGESLVDWALRFRVAGLFYREIKARDLPPELIPVESRNRLRDAYRNLAMINTSLFLDAAKVIKSFAGHQLPVMALKGLALAKTIYGDLALRPMNDLDLLVKEADLVRAGRILLTLGYKQPFPAWERMVKTFHHVPPFANKNGTMIELHRTIVTPDSSIKIDLDGLWERACLIQVDTVEVQAFSPEDLFLHLCVHACVHLRTGLDLVPLCDLAGVIKTSGDTIDWQIVIKRARQWGGQKCVYLMLLLVRDLLDVALPDKIMSELKPDDYQSLFLDEAVGLIFDADASPSDQLTVIRLGQLSKIKKVKGLNGKVLALLERAFPSREKLARIYPVSISSPKIYVCYLFRLSRLTVYYTKMLVGLCRGDHAVIKAVHQEHRVGAVSDWMFS